jgi:hypothetical protein
MSVEVGKEIRSHLVDLRVFVSAARWRSGGQWVIRGEEQEKMKVFRNKGKGKEKEGCCTPMGDLMFTCKVKVESVNQPVDSERVKKR